MAGEGNEPRYVVSRERFEEALDDPVAQERIRRAEAINERNAKVGEGNEPRMWTLHECPECGDVRFGLGVPSGPWQCDRYDQHSHGEYPDLVPVEVVEVSALEAERARTIREVVEAIRNTTPQVVFGDRELYDDDLPEVFAEFVRERFGSPSKT